MAGTIVASGIGSAIGSTRVPGQDQCLFVEWAGRLSSWEPASGTVTHLGSGWTQPEGIFAADAQVAYITERGGDVLKVDLNNGDRANASVVTSGLDAPHQAVLSVDGASLYVVEFGPAGRLLRVDLATGTTDVLVSGLERAISLALSPDESMAYVTEQAVAGRPHQPHRSCQRVGQRLPHRSNRALLSHLGRRAARRPRRRPCGRHSLASRGT